MTLNSANRKLLAILTAVTTTCFGVPPISAATITIGPGAISTPLEINAGPYQDNEVRFVPGTEVQTDTFRTSQDGKEVHGDFAAYFYPGPTRYVIEGGLFEGASVSPGPNVNIAVGGSAIRTYFGRLDIDFNGGTFRGGSVIVDEPRTGTSFVGVPAFQANSRAILFVKINGGLFEGGTVRRTSSPDAPFQRAIAFSAASQYGGLIEIFGGQFVGGFEFGHATLKIYGTDLIAQYWVVDELHPNRQGLRVSGKYFDGTPFNQMFYPGTSATRRVVIEQNSVTVFASEPSSGIVAVLGCALVSGARCRKRRSRRAERTPHLET